MARSTVHGGVSDMDADREEARRNLLSQGNADPSPEQLDAELQVITDKRRGSAHLEQGDGTSVTPESQAAKLDGDTPGDAGAEDGAGDAQPEGSQYDPSGHTVEEVNAYLNGLADDEAGSAEFARVIEAETAGKNRVGIVG